MAAFNLIMLAAFPPTQQAFWLAHLIIGAHRPR